MPTTDMPSFHAYLRLESVDPTRNRFRFFTLPWQPTLWGEVPLVRIWGRMGTPGRGQVIAITNPTQVQAALQQVGRRRLQHGYQLVAWQ